MKLNIAICEDQSAEAEALRQLLLELYPACEVWLFDSGEGLLKSSELRRLHLIFLDIFLLGEMNGIETAERIRAAVQDVAIVFTTASKDYALDGFRLDAMQYLIKPVQRQAVQKVVLECLSQRRGKAAVRVKLPVRSAGLEVSREVALDQIMYAEVYGYHSYVHLTNEILEVRMALDELASLLRGSEFLRCHRAYIVNLAYVRSIDRDFKMKNGEVVYIRRGDVKKCAVAYKEFLMERTLRMMP